MGCKALDPISLQDRNVKKRGLIFDLPLQSLPLRKRPVKAVSTRQNPLGEVDDRLKKNKKLILRC